MYQAGQIVSYTATGVCRISALTERSIDGRTTRYYQLEPLLSRGATVLVPTDSAPLLRRLRPLLSAREVLALLEQLPTAPDLWTDNESERKLLYREIFSGNDAAAMARLAYSLYRRRQMLAARGRRLRQTDETAWKDAERLLCEEFSYVLKKDPQELRLRLRPEPAAT